MSWKRFAFALVLSMIVSIPLAQAGDQQWNTSFASYDSQESAWKAQTRQIVQLQDELRQIRDQSAVYLGPESDGYAGDCCDGCRGDCDDGCGGSGFFAFYENVIVQPFFTLNAAAVIEDPPPVNSGSREIPFDWDYSYSPRIEFGQLNNCGCVGWRVRYWHIDTDANLTSDNADTFAAFADDGEDISISGPSTFSHDLKMDVIDLEATFGDRGWTYSAGVRYAHMDQAYAGRETGGADAIFADHDFDAFGITTAIGVRRPCSCNFSVFSKARASALYGESNWQARDEGPNAVLERTNDADMMAVGEFQIGVDWRTHLACNRVFYVTFALEAQYWLNAGSGGPINSHPFDEGNYQNAHPLDADMGFFGGTLGIGLEF